MSRGSVENLLKVPKLETFIEDHLITKKELFLGIHNENIVVYYWGRNILELTYFKDNKGTAKINKKFINGTALCGLKFIEKSNHMYFAFTDLFIKTFLESYQMLKDNIEKQVDESLPIEKKSGSLAKKYQGVIPCDNNSNKDSDWYCFDVDYCPEDSFFGKVDIVAISKNIENGKHRLMLIKLKYSWQGYKSGYRKNLYNDKKNKGYYIEAKDLKTRQNKKGEQHARRFGCKYDEKNRKIVSFDFGSGIVGDFYNYARFLFDNQGKAYQQLKEECYDMLSTKKKLGVFDENDTIGETLLNRLEETKEAFIDEISDTPECVFLTIGCDSLEKAKASMTSYLRSDAKNALDVVSCKNDKWRLYYNNGKGKIQTVISEVSLDDSFPKKMEEHLQYLFTKTKRPDNLNILNDLDPENDDMLRLNIFS